MILDDSGISDALGRILDTSLSLGQRFAEKELFSDDVRAARESSLQVARFNAIAASQSAQASQKRNTQLLVIGGGLILAIVLFRG